MEAMSQSGVEVQPGSAAAADAATAPERPPEATSPAERSGETRPKSRPRLPSLRSLITLIVVIPISLVSLALVFIATFTSRTISEQLGQEIVDRATERAISDVRAYLGTAMRVSDLYEMRLRDGALSSKILGA